MDTILDGIFALNKAHKEKLVLVVSLRCHIQKVDSITSHKIISSCISKLTGEKTNKRVLAIIVMESLFQVHPEQVMVALSNADIANTQYVALCANLVYKTLQKHMLISYSQGRSAALIMSRNKNLRYTTDELDVIVNTMQHIKHWFEDQSLWIQCLFYYRGRINHDSFLQDELPVPDRTFLVEILKLIGVQLAEGNLAFHQGAMLSTITDTTIVDTACQEFVRSLPEQNLSKCFDNLMSLQTRGLVLSHWILGLMDTLCNSHQYMSVLSLAERYTEVLIHQKGADSVNLLCRLLLLHQHSPHLFHRYFIQLRQLEGELDMPSLTQTVQCLMMRFPHFSRLYGSYTSVDSAQRSWISSHKLLTNSKLRFHRAVGFQNLGNTCYFNSLLQALWLSVPFQNGVIFNHVESSILSELRRLFLNLTYSVRGTFSPDTLFHVVRPSWFSFGSQQDSAELLRHLFDLISTGQADNSPQSSMLDRPGSLLGGDFSVESSKYCRHSLAPKDLTTDSQPSLLVTQHFQGTQEIRIICSTCKVSSSREEKFLFMSLPCVTDTQYPSLEHLISQSLATEQMCEDNQYYCDKCTVKCDATRITSLVKLPNTFILTLNRFSYDKVLGCRSKLLTRVTIPPDIRFAQNDAVFTVSADGDVCYKLYAVVVHSGSTTESGHYYTYGVPSNYSTDILSNSLCFSDETVSLIEEDCINLPHCDIDTPYILFYERVACERILSPQDLDMTCLSDIVNNNVRYIQQQKKLLSVPHKVSARRQDDNDDDENRHVGGCHSNDIVASSSRFIY